MSIYVWVLQGDYKSLYGKYGREAKKTLIYLLKHHKITFLGSDCHHEKDFKLKNFKKIEITCKK